MGKKTSEGDILRLFVDKTIYANVDVKVLPQPAEYPYTTGKRFKVEITETDDPINFPVGATLSVTSQFIAMRRRPEHVTTKTGDDPR